MEHSYPLPETHPELSLFACQSVQEYRVENWYLARNGSRRIIRGSHGWTWREALLPIVVAYLWPKARHNYLSIGGIAFALLIFVWFKCTQVLYESVIAYPPHGLQLETHRGFPPHPLTVSRRFVPLTSLQDFFINEGLRRWDVRFYLVAMSKSSKGRYSLEVAYENILPHFPVLLEVYRGVHDALFEQPDQDSA